MREGVGATTVVTVGCDLNVISTSLILRWIFSFDPYFQ